MVERDIELSLTESFAKHKRNVLFVSAVVAILAVASPDEVKIPGLGTDESVTAPAAYFLLGCALAYFFLSYWVELLAVRARNREGAASNSLEGVTVRLSRLVDPLSAKIDSILEDIDRKYADLKLLSVDDSNTNMRNMYNKIEKLINEKGNDLSSRLYRLDQGDTKYKDIVEGYVRECINNLDNSFSAMKLAAKHLTDGHQVLVRSGDSLRGELGDLTNNVKQLSIKIDRISSRISRSQRLGFGALEQAVPIALAILGLAVCADGAFFDAKGATLIRNQIPVLANQSVQAQIGPNVMPKVELNRRKTIDFTSTKG